MMITEGVGVITGLRYDIRRHSLVILHHIDMVLDTPDICRIETMAIEIISNIILIVNMGNIANVNIVESTGAMVGIDSSMMIG
jgi:hypothetical protein